MDAAVDRALLKRHLRGARERGERDFLPREIEARMRARLACVRLLPRRILALGRAADLSDRYPAAHCLCMGENESATVIAAADNDKLLLPDGSVDLIWANLFEYWRHDWARSLREARRVLRPGGLLMLSAFGPGAAQELRAGLDVPETTLPCLGPHALGNLLLHTGFVDSVTDTENITLTYTRLGTLFADLRAIAPDLFFPAAGKGANRLRWQELLRRYEDCRAKRQDGKFPARVEILYAHAWAPAEEPCRCRAPAGTRVFFQKSA
ncbi:MAG: methyltransferase domain-containing protein [Zoogloeaceae bacterium]|jgi:malonyl-CoA O-methyltransferase|nr:methyltransferase domain-containing protein [Zoogloeaceae bacterium]